MEDSAPETIRQEDIAEALANEQLRMVWEHSSFGVLVATFAAVLLVSILPTELPAVVLRSWLAVKLAVGLSRLVQALIFLRTGRAGGPRWRRWTYALLGVDGLVWGVAGLLVLFNDAGVLSTLIPTLACVGIIAAYGLQARLVATALYVGPILLIPAAALLFRGGQYVAWALGILSSLALLLSTARQHENRLAENFLLRMELSRTAKQREEAAKVAALREALEAKSQFLATVSHELRSPLQSILSALDVLEMRFGMAQAEQASLVQRIRRAAYLLNKQLQDLLTLARGESGRLEMRPEPFEVRELVEGAAVVSLEAATEKGLQLVWEVPAEPLFVVADAARIDQALTNLISNAVRYTANGSVRVILEPYDESDKTIRIQVTDTGPGIPADVMPRIFSRYERFGKVDQTREGAGIGLSVVKTVMEYLGGHIVVDSREEAGTTFRLQIPAIRLSEPAVPAVGSAEAPRVLAVDDRADVLDALSSVIRASGFTCDTASSAALAANLLAAYKYDVALIDIEMPVKSGVELASETRRGDGPNSRTRLVAMSAAENGARHGGWPFDAYLSKPIDRLVLLRALGVIRPPEPHQTIDVA